MDGLQDASVDFPHEVINSTNKSNQELNNRRGVENKGYEQNREEDATHEIQNNSEDADQDVFADEILARMKGDIQYGVDDIPPWYTTIMLALQHFLLMFSGVLALPLILAGPLCINSPVARTELIGTFFFVSGIATLFQSTFGIRLPIVQGGTFSFLIPTFAILKIRGPCLDFNAANATIAEEIEAEEFWQGRMREIQGVIIVASFVQILLGFTGLMGVLLRFIGPLTIAPTIGLIGLSLFEVAQRKMADHWPIGMFTVVLITVFSQVLVRWQLPLPGNRKFPIFKLFPIILAIIIAWILCGILTASNAFPNDPEEYGYFARTDIFIDGIKRSTWFKLPYPGQWGLPTVTFAGVLGMISGVMASVIESIGDYYACARLGGVPPPPPHAINRGIGVEGIGGVIAGLYGTGNGTTSYSQNVGAIGLTKVASRVVIQVVGCMLIFVGIIGKLNALFATIPNPVIGGVVAVTFGMVTAVGISNLQFVDLNSSRNLFIVGLSFFLGLSVPNYLRSQDGPVQIVGNDTLNQIILVLLQTGMFVGGATGMILDNLITGTPEERGIIKWKESFGEQDSTGSPSVTADVTAKLLRVYDLPLITPWLRKRKWSRYIPFSPTFRGFILRQPNDNK